MPTLFRPYHPDQSLLLPPSPRDWLPGKHLACFVAETIDALRLSAFYEPYEGDGRRKQPYDPAMMLKVLVYAYATGTYSSRKIDQKPTASGTTPTSSSKSEPLSPEFPDEPKKSPGYLGGRGRRYSVGERAMILSLVAASAGPGIGVATSRSRARTFPLSTKLCVRKRAAQLNPTRAGLLSQSGIETPSELRTE